MSESYDEDTEFFEYDISLADLELPSIRLLVIWPPGDDAVDGYIHCSLSEHPLNDCPQYEALSYTWGSNQDRSFIICNGKPHDITSSLYEILVWLRRSEERVIWIDQISINQQDDREKSQQVNMMRDIYQRASQTIAWLGSPNSSSEKAFETLHKLRTAGLGAFRDCGDEDRAERDPEDIAYLTAIARDPKKYWGGASLDRTEVSAVYRLLTSPWFTRMWIIQEAIVSKQLVLHSGKYSISLNDLIFAINILDAMRLESRRNLHIFAKGGKDMLQTLALCRFSYQAQDTSELNLIRLLCHCRQFQATDQRDRLFALYGLTSTPLPDLGLRADYIVSARQILASTYAALICSDRSLRLLELSETSSESDLPSWIPLQRTPRDSKLYPLSSLCVSHKFTEEILLKKVVHDIVTENLENADAESEIEPINSVIEQVCRTDKFISQPSQPADQPLGIGLLDDSTLCVEGQLLDRVTQVGPVAIILGTMAQEHAEISNEVFIGFENIGNNDDTTVFEVFREVFGITSSFVKAQLAEWRAFIGALTSMDIMVISKKTTPYYQSESAILTAYRNTVCAGTLAPEKGKDVNRYGWNEERSIEAFDKWRETIGSSVKIDRMKKRLGMETSAGSASLLMSSIKAHASYDINSKLMLGNAMSPLFGRRLAWTSRGHLALVPARTAVNDHIFALKGGEMPFVLRSHENGWKILGPTYVDGMMKGELLDDSALGPIRLV